MKSYLTKRWARLDHALHIRDLMLFIGRARLNLMGPAFAYYVLLTLFPMLIAVVALVAALHKDTVQALNVMGNVLPDSIMAFLQPVFESIAKAKTRSYLSISLLFILWSLSQVTALLRRTFNDIAGVKERVAPFLTRAWAFLWLIIVVVAFTALLVAGNIFSVLVENYTGLAVWVAPTRWLIVLGLWLVMTAMNYWLPTKAARPPFHIVLFGSLVDLGLLSAVNKTFAAYANLQFGRYGFYQSITSIIVFLVWLNIIAIILASGYILMTWLATFPRLQRRKGKHVSKD
ncbi:YihY/virulence factor BrkB family protein [Leuconostocaceae bacterium ESL0958]|nr:YihY/virulence factor BrkB family protein [Leuconostocaceae bacterium ESL0958]